MTGPIFHAEVDHRSEHAWIKVAEGPAVVDGGVSLGAYLQSVVSRALADGAAQVHWAVETPFWTEDRSAELAGLSEQRDLFQLRRPLPVEPDLAAGAPAIAVRPFRAGTADEAAWISANNLAFAHHADQGHETVATLHKRMAEPWFDADGFLLLDGDPPVDDGGHLDGFCWTKLHPSTDTDPELGEIYVIGVHPEAMGRGLGKALVLAGLASINARGVHEAMLYVDADNAPALALYAHLGFTRHHIHRVYSTPTLTSPS